MFDFRTGKKSIKTWTLLHFIQYVYNGAFAKKLNINIMHRSGHQQLPAWDIERWLSWAKGTFFIIETAQTYQTELNLAKQTNETDIK